MLSSKKRPWREVKRRHFTKWIKSLTVFRPTVMSIQLLTQWGQGFVSADVKIQERESNHSRSYSTEDVCTWSFTFIFPQVFKSWHLIWQKEKLFPSCILNTQLFRCSEISFLNICVSITFNALFIDIWSPNINVSFSKLQISLRFNKMRHRGGDECTGGCAV